MAIYSDRFNRGEKLSSVKSTVVQYGILVLMLGLAAGLWRLQILGASNFKELAEQNRIRKEPIMAPRGRLFDRYGHLLVDNYPSVSCFLVREQNKRINDDLPLIAQGLHLDLDQLKATLKHYRYSPGYQPIPIKQDISPDEQAFIAAHSNELPELETIDVERRLYPRDGFASHVIGYVGEVSEADLDNNPRYAYYEPGDVVGKAGVEATYDQILRGQDGSRDVIVDSHGREVGFLGTQHAIPGQDLRLTIDIDLQREAELALGSANGAVIVMDPRNGEILALVSHPNYDPNDFAVRIKSAEWNQLITNPDHPLMNKAIQDQLAPGSTFKIIMSAAGLQEGVAQNMKVDCIGGGWFYGRFFKCDQHHGVLNISQAIPLSCDTFFYTLAQRLGIDTIAKYAEEFGLAQKTGIDLPNEMSGVMPSSEWEWRNFHHKYYPGNTISVGIGQGETQVTPIQLIRALAGIASDGHLVRPHLVNPNQLPADFRSALYESLPGSGNRYVPLNPDTWDIITNGMAAATTTGTAAASHIQGVDFAGKTGTAQVVGGSGTHVRGGKETPNSWFVGMVPRRNPEIAVVVLQEHGDWGSNSAKIAQAIVIAYINKTRSQDHNLLEQANSPQKPVEVGAVWSNPMPAGSKHGPDPIASVTAGHFYIYPGTESGAEAKDIAMKQLPLPALFAAPVSWKQARWKKDGSH